MNNVSDLNLSQSSCLIKERTIRLKGTVNDHACVLTFQYFLCSGVALWLFTTPGVALWHFYYSSVSSQEWPDGSSSCYFCDCLRSGPNGSLLLLEWLKGTFTTPCYSQEIARRHNLLLLLRLERSGLMALCYSSVFHKSRPSG